MSRRKSQTRLGIISDVHGDAASLKDALDGLARLDVAQVVCAGDLVDWGTSPGRCIGLLRERGVSCVRGNHDFLDADGATFAPRIMLAADAVRFVDALPFSRRLRIAGARVLVTHARPGDLMRGIHPDRAELEEILAAARAEILIVGHVHVPMQLTGTSGVVLNPGSILREPPSEEPIRASGTFAVLELPSRRYVVYRSSDGAEVPFA